jgi:hypothetical protein
MLSSTTEALQPAADLAKAQLSKARGQLFALRGKAEKSLKRLTSRGRARGKELSAFARQLPPAGKARLEQWQGRLLYAVGVATRGQIRELSRELHRISKKLDALSSAK